MTLFTITSIISFILTFGIGIIFLLKVKSKKISTNFGWTCIASSIWAIGAWKFSTSYAEDVASFWLRIAHVGIILTPTFYFHWISNFVNKSSKKITLLVYISASLALVLNFIDRNFYTVVFASKSLYFYKINPFHQLPYLVFYISFYICYFFYSFILLLKFYKTTTGNLRNQVRYLIIASIIAWLGLEGMFLYIISGIPLYPYSNILIGIYPVILAYAILKYRLMDIRVAITRTSIFITVYTIVLGIPFAVVLFLKSLLINLFGAYWWMFPLVLMATLTTVGPFLYIYFQQKAETKLLREQKRYQDTLKQASIVMTRIHNLNHLLNLITHIVTKTVRISYVAIYLYDKEKEEYVLQVSRGKSRVSILAISANNPLIKWLIREHQPLIYEEVKRYAEDSKESIFRILEENMRTLAASVVIPNFLEDKFLGFLVLGNKISGQIYTPEDLNVFQILASQAVLAIENAQFYEETKEMQEQVSQAEKMATIGTMADGLSHQINNRFYALSLIAGDTIDVIKNTDTSSCTPEIKRMIEQISHALQRIQENVTQGGEVVRGLLKYSRKGEDKYEPLDLNTIIDNTLEMIQFKVKLSKIDLYRNFPVDSPKIKGNMTQLEEVFFNFIDNAYDAIVERHTVLKEEGYRGRITISARPKDNMIEITVEDNGMGIKDDTTKKVFTPFFTTKISSRKGTGLGLYVIKRIITEMHKGRISFESRYKFGTRFIVELPIAA